MTTPDDREVKEGDLIIPVYLNQRVVFDLLAMLTDGMSTVTRISATEENVRSEEQRYGASFGLSQALSALLKVSVGGNKTKGSQSGSELHRSEEKVHTPASLFQKLRAQLRRDGLVTEFDGSGAPKAGDIVEFTTALHKNPLIHAMDVIVSAYGMYRQLQQKPQAEQRNKFQAREAAQTEEKLHKQMEWFANSLKAGRTIDMISGKFRDFRAVVTVEEEYLNDPSMADLVDGQFRVLGKVVRVILDAGGSVSLLRKTAIGAMQSVMVREFLGHLTSARQILQLPELEVEVTGPVIHVIPVAIFA
jgi:hypothetical protein